MITLYVGGKKVANWNEAEKLFAETARSQRIEFRDESGQIIATSMPEAEDDPDWVKAITPEETARRMAEPFLTYEEMKQKLGWE